MVCTEIVSEAQWGMYSQKPGVVVIDFFADWCKSCLEILPDYEKTSNEFTDVTFCKLDIDNDELDDIIEEQSIKTIPMFIILKDGDIMEQYIGRDINVLLQKLNTVVST